MAALQAYWDTHIRGHKVFPAPRSAGKQYQLTRELMRMRLPKISGYHSMFDIIDDYKRHQLHNADIHPLKMFEIEKIIRHLPEQYRIWLMDNINMFDYIYSKLKRINTPTESIGTMILRQCIAISMFKSATGFEYTLPRSLPDKYYVTGQYIKENYVDYYNGTR